MDQVGTDGRDTLVGSDGDDLLRGLGGRDSLVGGDGGDTLNGGEGNDTMVGGAGNDVYHVDSIFDKDGGLGGDRIQEAANGGVDTVIATVSYYMSIGDNLENLILRKGDWSAVGNDTDNTLVGDTDSNYMDGEGGADRLYGGGGNDDLRGSSGDDTITGGAGRDALQGGDDNDILFTSGGGDLLDGGMGPDTYRFTGLTGIRTAVIYSLEPSDVIDLRPLDARQVDHFDGAPGAEFVVLHGGRHADHMSIAFDADSDQIADHTIKVMGHHSSFDGIVS